MTAAEVESHLLSSYDDSVATLSLLMFRESIEVNVTLDHSNEFWPFSVGSESSILNQLAELYINFPK